MQRELRHAIPFALVYSRAVMAPAFLLVYALDAARGWYLLLLFAGFLSDVYDGILARRWGVSSPRLRSLDSACDTLFYIGVVAAAWLAERELILRCSVPIGILIALEITRHVFDRIKFKQAAAYHMYSAKLWGVALLWGFVETLGFGHAGYGLPVAAALGILTDVEGLWASWVLPSWHSDVPSIVHAYRLRARSLASGPRCRSSRLE